MWKELVSASGSGGGHKRRTSCHDCWGRGKDCNGLQPAVMGTMIQWGGGADAGAQRRCVTARRCRYQVEESVRMRFEE